MTPAEVRTTLGDVWFEVLKTRPDEDSDFFALGGSSLELIELLLAVDRKFGLMMSIDELFSSEFTFGASADAVSDALRQEAG